MSEFGEFLAADRRFRSEIERGLTNALKLGVVPDVPEDQDYALELGLLVRSAIAIADYLAAHGDPLEGTGTQSAEWLHAMGDRLLARLVPDHDSRRCSRWMN